MGVQGGHLDPPEPPPGRVLDARVEYAVVVVVVVVWILPPYRTPWLSGPIDPPGMECPRLLLVFSPCEPGLVRLPEM